MHGQFILNFGQIIGTETVLGRIDGRIILI
jgi:hypothetical protein